jgi:AraC-like DNA-binding protein
MDSRAIAANVSALTLGGRDLLLRKLDTARQAPRFADGIFRRAIALADHLVDRLVSSGSRQALAEYLSSRTALSNSISGRLVSYACHAVTPDAVPLTLVSAVFGAVLGALLLYGLQLVFIPALAPLSPSRVCARLRLLALHTPWPRRKIAKELDAIRQTLRGDFSKVEGMCYPQLPDVGLSESDISAQLTEWSEGELTHWIGGKLSGQVYHERDMADRVAIKAYELYSLSNPLHPSSFPSVRKMEAEVISMTATLFHCPQSCGAMTSGGTESIIMAVLAYKRWARATKCITNPNMVVPATAHAAFDKASQYLDVEIRKVPVDPSTMRALPHRMRREIDSNTITLVCSAIAFPHGTLDPVSEVASMAMQYRIGCHVDCKIYPASRPRRLVLANLHHAKSI